MPQKFVIKGCVSQAVLTPFRQRKSQLTKPENRDRRSLGQVIECLNPSEEGSLSENTFLKAQSSMKTSELGQDVVQLL